MKRSRRGSGSSRGSGSGSGINATRLGGEIRNGNADGIVGLEMLMAVGLRTHVQGTGK